MVCLFFRYVFIFLSIMLYTVGCELGRTRGVTHSVELSMYVFCFKLKNMTEFCLKILISVLQNSFFAWNLSYLLLAKLIRSTYVDHSAQSLQLCLLYFFTFAKKKVELDCQIFQKTLWMKKLCLKFWLSFKVFQNYPGEILNTIVGFFKISVIPLLCQLMVEFSKSFWIIRKLKGLSLM